MAAKLTTMNTQKFDFEKWLSERAAKQSTKTVNFSDLTKIEKVETLLALLEKTETDFLKCEPDTIVTVKDKDGKETKKTIAGKPLFWINGSDDIEFGKATAIQKAAILTGIIDRLKSGETDAKMPSDKDIVNVSARTSFGAATLTAKINFLSAMYNKPLETVTIQLPCGADWVEALKQHILDTAIGAKEEETPEKEA